MKNLAFFLIEIGKPFGFLYSLGFKMLLKEAKTQDETILLYMLSCSDGDDELEAIQKLSKMDALVWVVRIMECLRMAEGYPYTEYEYRSHLPEVDQIIDDATNRLPGPIWELCCNKWDSMLEKFASKFGDVDW